MKSLLLGSTLIALVCATAQAQQRVPALQTAQDGGLPPVMPTALAAPPPASSGQAPQPVYPMRAPPTFNPISQAPVRLTDKQRQGAGVARRWQERASAPATGEYGAVTFDYGATQPSIVCAPLQICMLELQAGETILQGGLQAGDTVRWSITPGLTGTGSAQQTVVVIKPSDAGLRTTLGIMTNKRVYSILLVSTQSQSMPLAQFSYPEDTQAKWTAYYQQQHEEQIATTLPGGLNTANLDFNYTLSGDSPAWRPLRVYNDGVRTYIQFPPAMRSTEAPSLVALARDGGWFSSPSNQLVNYRKVNDTYVVDKVLDRASLIVGVGSSQERVTITHAEQR